MTVRNQFHKRQERDAVHLRKVLINYGLTRFCGWLEGADLDGGLYCWSGGLGQ